VPATIKIEINSQASGSGFRDAQEGLNQIDQSAQKASGGISGIGAMAAGALGGIVVSAAASAASAIAGVVGSTVGLAGQFEGGMNEFAAAAGGSLEQAGLSVGQFQDLFLQLGSELPVSTMEVQQAAIALVKGGLDPAVLAAGGLRDNLLFASAAGMGLEEAANLSVKMLGTFTNVTDDAATKTAFMAESQNLLVKAANASTLDVASLGDAMLQAGGQARTMGLGYEDFVTTMGLISPAFGSAAEAGTSFKNFLVRLQPTTGPAKDAMEALGLYTKETGSAFFDAEGKFVGVEKASELLKQTTEGLSAEQRVLAFQTIFGNDAMGAAAALAAGGATAYQLFAEQMANANGIAEQSAAVQQGLDFAMTSLQGTIESIQIQIGLKFLPVLTQLVFLANNVLNAFMGSKTAFDALPGPIQVIVSGMLALATAFQNAFAEATSIFNFFVRYLPAALSEIISFVMTGKSHFMALRTVVSMTQTLLQDALGGLVSFVRNTLTSWASALAQWGPPLFYWIIQIMPQVLTALNGLITNIITFVTNNAPVLVAQLVQWSQAFWSWIAQAIPRVQVGFAIFLANIITFLATAVPTLLSAFGNWTVGAIQWIVNAIPGAVLALGQFINSFVGSTQTSQSIIVDAFANFTSAMYEWVTNAIPPMLTRLGMAITTLLTYLQYNVPLWQAQLLVWGNQLWQWIVNAVPPMLTQLGVWLGQILGYLAANLPTFIVELLKWATAFVQWIADNIPVAIVKLGEWVASVIKWLTDVGIPEFQKWGGEAAKAFIAWVADDLIPKVAPALGNFVTAMTDYMTESLKAIGTAALDIGGAIIEGIAKGIGDNARKLVDEAIAAAKGALTAVRNMLGMKSPSRVFANEVGLPMAQGMAVGLAKGAPLVAGAAGQVAASGLSGAQRVTNTANTRNVVYNATFNNVGSMSVSDAIARSLAGV